MRSQPLAQPARCSRLVSPIGGWSTTLHPGCSSVRARPWPSPVSRKNRAGPIRLFRGGCTTRAEHTALRPAAWADLEGGRVACYPDGSALHQAKSGAGGYNPSAPGSCHWARGEVDPACAGAAEHETSSLGSRKQPMKITPDKPKTPMVKGRRVCPQTGSTPLSGLF